MANPVVKRAKNTKTCLNIISIDFTTFRNFFKKSKIFDFFDLRASHPTDAWADGPRMDGHGTEDGQRTDGRTRPKKLKKICFSTKTDSFETGISLIDVDFTFTTIAK